MKKFTAITLVVVALVTLLGFTAPAFASSGNGTRTEAQLWQAFQTSKNPSALYASLTPADQTVVVQMFTVASTSVRTSGGTAVAANTVTVIPMTTWVWQSPFGVYLSAYNSYGQVLYTIYNSVTFTTNGKIFTLAYQKIWGTVSTWPWRFDGYTSSSGGGTGYASYESYCQGHFQFGPNYMGITLGSHYPVIDITLNAATKGIKVTYAQN